MRRVKAGIATVALFGLLSCSPKVTEVPLDGLEGAYVFMVVADDAGLPLRVVAAVGAGTAGEGISLPSTAFKGRETQFFLLSVRADELRALLPAFDPLRVAEMELLRTPPPAQPTYESRDPSVPSRIALALPPGVAVFKGLPAGQGTVALEDLERTPLTATPLGARLTLMVPVTAEACRPSQQTDLRPFAATAEPLKGAVAGNLALSWLTWLNDDRLLVAGASIVTWVDRGEALPAYEPGRSATEPDRWMHLEQVVPMENQGYIASAALSPLPDALGRREILLVGGKPRASEGTTTPTITYGWIRRGWLQDEGLSWDPSFVQLLPDFSSSVEFSADGRAFVGTQGAHIWSRTATQAEFVRADPGPKHFRPSDNNDVQRLRATEHPRWTMIASTSSGFHLWDKTQETWSNELIEQDGILAEEALKFNGIDSHLEDDDFRVFMSTQLGTMVWRTRPGQDWKQDSLPYPPRFRPCASATPDEQEKLAYLRRDIAALEVQDGFIYLAHGECSALVMVKEPAEANEPLCVALLPVEGEPVSVLTGDLQGGRTLLAARPSAVAVASPSGGIYLTEW